MLPDGFHWQGHHDGYALVLDGRIVATVTPVVNAVRVEINPNLVNRRTVFFATMSTGRAYMVAWARKWEPRIHEAYRRLRC